MEIYLKSTTLKNRKYILFFGNSAPLPGAAPHSCISKIEHRRAVYAALVFAIGLKKEKVKPLSREASS